MGLQKKPSNENLKTFGKMFWLFYGATYLDDNKHKIPKTGNYCDWETSSYLQQQLSNTVFCLCLYGYHPWSSRAIEAIMHGRIHS